MEIEKDEYLCSVSFSMVYDPVNIAPTRFLYDRNTAETWIEKNPRNATIPQTRQPFAATDITPDAALRAEMREHFQHVMGSEYTGWEVIPDYPQRLSLDGLGELLTDVRRHFPGNDGEENLNQMSVESWTNAWKRLTFLRLNLQLCDNNRQLFLSDEQSVKSLSEFIVISYTRGRKTEESDLFHREILRTIRALDLTTHQERHQLKPDTRNHCAKFTGFLLRFLNTGDEALQPIVLGLLSFMPGSLEPNELYSILAYLSKAQPLAISSTDLTNLAQIQDDFFRRRWTDVSCPLVLQMQKRLVEGFVQIVIYAVGIFKSEDRIGVVEDACEALRIALFHLNQLLGCNREFRETRLAFSIDMNLLTYIHEIIEQAVKQQSPHWVHLSANHWLLALNVAKIFYQNLGNSDLMTEREYMLYLSFLHSPIARDSKLLRGTVSIILRMFERFAGIEPYR